MHPFGLLRGGASAAYRPLRLALIWLLQLNRPVPQHTEDEIAAQIERDYSWNFVVNLLDGAFFWFGMSFASTTTILPLFISKLTPSPLAIGVLGMIAQGGWFVPQLFTANIVERLPRKKPVVVNLGLFTERLPMWLLVLAAAIAGRTPGLALVVLLGAFAWHAVGAGVLATSWQDMVARIFPVERRGRFLGTTNFFGAGAGALGAGFSAWLLSSFPFPTNFVYTFAIAAGFIQISWFWLALAREPAQTATTLRQSTRDYLANLPELLRRDHNFRRFMVARLLMAVAGMGVSFVTVAAIRRWAVPDATVGLYTALLLAGQTVGNLVFGFLADRFGHKLSLELGILASTTGFVLAWLAPAAQFYFAAYLLFGIGSSVAFGSALLVVMEFCEPGRRPTYTGIANTGAGMIGLVAPLLGAGLAEIGFELLFAVCAAVSLAAFVLMRWWVREPRWAAKSDPLPI